MVNEIKTFEQRKEELVKKGKEKGILTVVRNIGTKYDI